MDDLVQRLRDWRGDPDEVMDEAADELERLRKIEAEWAALSQDDGKAEREIERLSSELDHFKNSGIIEVAVLNASVSEYMRHWEGRALSAEAEIERLRAQLAARDRDAERYRHWRDCSVKERNRLDHYASDAADAAIDAAMDTPKEPK